MDKMRKRLWPWIVITLVLPALRSAAQTRSDAADDPNAKPAVTQSDLKIVQRARQILSLPANWNRADTRVCPADAKAFSLYCALEQATVDVTGKFEHRGAAMQEARFVIGELAPDRNYNHRLMDYNNDPRTTFADTQKFFQALEERIQARLKEQSTQK